MLELLEKDFKAAIIKKNVSAINYKFSFNKWKNRKSQQRTKVIKEPNEPNGNTKLKNTIRD